MRFFSAITRSSCRWRIMTDAINSLNFYFPVVLQPKLGMECCTVKVSRSHTFRHTHMVGHLRMSDQPVVEATTYTTHNKQDKHPCLQVDSDPRSQLQTCALYHTANGNGNSNSCYYILLSQDSVGLLNKVTGLSARQSRVHIFLFCKTCWLTLGPTQLPVQRVTGILSAEVKWLGPEADQSPSTSDEVREQWSYTSTLPTCLSGEHRNNCTSLYYYTPVTT